MPTELSAKERARAALRARRHSARRIRRSVVAFGVAAFLAVWLGIYVQMVEGKDPALSASRKRVATTAASAVKTSSSTTARARKAAAQTTTSTSSGSTSSSPSPVTTSQS